MPAARRHRAGCPPITPDGRLLYRFSVTPVARTATTHILFEPLELIERLAS